MVNKNLYIKYDGRYRNKLKKLKQLIREYVHENAAIVDEINDVQEQIIIRTEERKFLLRKLCQFDPQVEIQVQQFAKTTFPQSEVNSPAVVSEKKKKKKIIPQKDKRVQIMKSVKSKKTSAKVRKKLVQPIPLDISGRPVFPIELGSLTLHCLGEIIPDKLEFHCEEAIFPVGYVSTRIYGNFKDPLKKCIYTCKISESNGFPRFEISTDNDNSMSIVGGTADICHSLLLQQINDCLSLNVVSTRPRGKDFFGLTHPVVSNLIQSSPGARRCVNYKWTKFEVSKMGDHSVEDKDACLNFEALQRNINYCKYKMAPEMFPKP
ncbi:transforming growth factor beta regulator 1 [Agrilus planipennis]|uniref:Transforming growth factor beta regulator 1 n=1 Tax=Agrilus planipennis TaxID=224129 RepID=A0A1W4WU40_AGRPL|nr:transforming growth factor beta regulator 1 [Agrilus planipennis]